MTKFDYIGSTGVEPRERLFLLESCNTAYQLDVCKRVIVVGAGPLA